MLKKAKIGLMVLVFLFTAIVGIKPVDGRDTTEEMFTVELQPIRVSARAAHILRVKFHTSIAAKETLSIQWPEGTIMPELPKDPSKRKAELIKIIESIYIGAFPCGSCHSVPTLDEKERRLTFHFPRNINPKDEDYTHTTIVIPNTAGFANPSTPGSYTLKLITSSHGTMTSSPYLVVESKIGVPKGQPEVSVQPYLPMSPASYRITFNVGEGGALLPSQSLIRIRFPESVSYHPEKHGGYGDYIKINQVPLRASYTWNKNLLLMYTPTAVPNAGRVQIEISQKVGLVNPPNEGEYYIEVSTSEDREWVQSHPFNIVNTDIPLFITPNKTNRSACFEILFSTGKEWKLNATHPLQIQFPKEFQLPEAIDANHFSFNDMPPSIVRITDHILTITPEKEISTQEPVRIFIDETAGIINPSLVGLTNLTLLPFGESQWYQTRSVRIEEASLMVPRVQPDLWNACETTSYRVILETGQKGLIAQDDWIELVFPPSFKLRSEIQPEDISINSQDVKSVTLSKGNRLRIVPGFSIDSYELVVDIVDSITNTCEGDQSYQLLARTSKELETVSSSSFFIAPPLPKVYAQWMGGTVSPHNWYSTPPLMKVWSSSEEADIMFSWVEAPKENFERYIGEQEMPEGFYRLDMYYYAQDSYGESMVHKIELQVNTHVPSFEILQPMYPVNYTNATQTDIIGRVEKDAMEDQGVEVGVFYDSVFINGEKVEVDPQNGMFSHQVQLNQSEQDFVITLKTPAALSSQRTLTFHFDQELPELQEMSPPAESTTMHHTLPFSAQTKPFSEVWINEDYIPVDPSGRIQHNLHSLEAGRKTFTIVINDRYGNKHTSILDYWFGLTIEMKIGRQTILSNATLIETDVPPGIYQQSTYLPVRALANLFQADLHIIADPKTGSVQKVKWITPFHHIEMTIGQKEAVVNGQEIVMTVPPIIIQQRLMMPVRWMIEQMDGTVAWDAPSETIRITYMEPEPR